MTNFLTYWNSLKTNTIQNQSVNEPQPSTSGATNNIIRPPLGKNDLGQKQLEGVPNLQLGPIEETGPISAFTEKTFESYFLDNMKFPEWDSFSTFVGGSVVSNLFSTFNQIGNTNFELNNRLGNGPLGNTFDLNDRISSQINQNNTINALQTAEITLGSAFGPEGLAIGAGAAALTGFVGSMFSPPSIQEQGVSGNMITSNPSTETINNDD